MVSLGEPIMPHTIWISAVVALCGILTLPVAAQTLADQRTALKEIRETAADICYTVQQEGQQSESKLAGQVEAKVNGVIAKIADLGLSGSGELKNESYQGIIRSELATTIKHSADCRKGVFDKLIERMLPSLTPDKPARGSENTIPKSAPVIMQESAGLKASILSLWASEASDHIGAVIALRNTSAQPLQLAGASQGIQGIANNGRHYVSGPGSLTGIAACRSNPSNCLSEIQRGAVSLTRLGPQEEAQMILDIYPQRVGRGGTGPVDSLVMLNVPIFRSSGAAGLPDALQEAAFAFTQVPIAKR